MGYGLLGSVFNFLDPVLDTLDPMHNKVQTWTTGSSDTAGQRPYFETIAPIILDAFLPGVGSAVGAVDKASTGNWGGAAISSLGAIGGMGGFSGSGATEATQATTATEAAPALTSTAGDAGGSVVASGGDAVSVGNDLNAASSAGGSGLSAPAASSYSGYQPMATGFNGGAEGGGLLATQSTGLSGGAVGGAYGGSAIAPSNYVGAAGGLNATGTATSSQLAANAPWYSKLNTPSVGKASGILGEQMIKQQMMVDQRNAEMKARAQQAMGSAAIPEPNANRSYSVQNASPYAQFNGGFNPKRYGANVRQRGILG